MARRPRHLGSIFIHFELVDRLFFDDDDDNSNNYHKNVTVIVSLVVLRFLRVLPRLKLHCVCTLSYTLLQAEAECVYFTCQQLPVNSVCQRVYAFYTCQWDFFVQKSVLSKENGTEQYWALRYGYSVLSLINSSTVTDPHTAGLTTQIVLNKPCHDSQDFLSSIFSICAKEQNNLRNFDSRNSYYLIFFLF